MLGPLWSLLVTIFIIVSRSLQYLLFKALGCSVRVISSHKPHEVSSHVLHFFRFCKLVYSSSFHRPFCRVSLSLPLVCWTGYGSRRSTAAANWSAADLQATSCSLWRRIRFVTNTPTFRLRSTLHIQYMMAFLFTLFLTRTYIETALKCRWRVRFCILLGSRLITRLAC